MIANRALALKHILSTPALIIYFFIIILSTTGIFILPTIYFIIYVFSQSLELFFYQHNHHRYRKHPRIDHLTIK